MRGEEIPTVRGTGENTPFAVQSRKKKRDNGHDNLYTAVPRNVIIACFFNLLQVAPRHVQRSPGDPADGRRKVFVQRFDERRCQTIGSSGTNLYTVSLYIP